MLSYLIVLFFLAVGYGFMGIKNLRKLKVEIEEKFGKVDKKRMMLLSVFTSQFIF